MEITRQPFQVADGLGVDSMAMLIGLAQRGIRPDAILFADTVAEKDETYARGEKVESWAEFMDRTLVNLS